MSNRGKHEPTHRELCSVWAETLSPKYSLTPKLTLRLGTPCNEAQTEQMQQSAHNVCTLQAEEDGLVPGFKLLPANKAKH